MINNKHVAIGLILGTATGAGFGILISAELMPLTAGIGCGLGIVTGSMLRKFEK